MLDHRGNSGAPVILIHDLGHSAAVWSDIATHLDARAGIMAPDLRGHGLSHAPEGEWPMAAVVDEVGETIDAAGIRDAMVVGMGFGGMIAQALAAEHPRLVRALVLIGTAPKLMTEAWWLDRGRQLAALDGDARADVLLDRTTRHPVPETLRSCVAATPAETVEKFCAAVAHTDLRQSTDTLRLPVLGLVGRADRITPPDLMREMIEGIPGADLSMIPGAGHLTPWDAPEETARHINAFMEQTGHLLISEEGST